MPFADIFPESARLASTYFTATGEDWPTLASTLRAWRVAVSEPLIVDDDFELKVDLVSKLSSFPLPPDLSADKTVACKQLSRISLLGDVIGRIGRDENRTKQFFEFLIKYLIYRDERWRMCVPVALDAENGNKTLSLRPSEWVGRIKRERWVPDISLGEAERAQVPATTESLGPLVPWPISE